MLHEIVPKAELMGVLANPTNPTYERGGRGSPGAPLPASRRMLAGPLPSAPAVQLLFSRLGHCGLKMEYRTLPDLEPIWV